MKQKRLTDEQIIGKEADAGTVVADLCQPQTLRVSASRHGMSSATFHAWKSKHGGLELSEAKRLLSEAMLDNAGLRDLLGKEWRRPPPGAKSPKRLRLRLGSRTSGPASGRRAA